ncbi:hypothetical protein BCR35DRAFT_324432 [Leucosporidium creatinivorum]|uniref:Uncharacterized protein n=1 Tax=Leucosporidium creatinivorum TaxID=106004 RepID=A0A1Y2FVW9_9BASI|nr:hypothetical protein BCR35DRAFT_324432 [Leucosporidium creatinivorum]
MSIFPTELVHLIFEHLWESLREHAGEDYLIRPAPFTVIFVFGQLRLVCSTWADLIENKFLIRLAEPRPDADLTLEKVGDLRVCRTLRLKAKRDEMEDTALDRWRAGLEGRTHLNEFIMSLQNSSNVMSFIPVSTLAESQLQTMADVVEELPEEQRRRIRKLTVDLEDEDEQEAMVTGFIRGSTLRRLAAILPEVQELRITADRPSELAERDEGSESEFWSGLRYIYVANMDIVTGPLSARAPLEISTITRIFNTSAATLREIVLTNTVCTTIQRNRSTLLEVFGRATYPSLTKLHILSPPRTHESPIDDALFAKFPALTDLALTLSETATPSFLSHLPRTLTHLTLELPYLNSLWSQAIQTFITARGSTLQFLSVDLPESVVNDNGEGTSRIILKEIRLIIKICRAYDVVFATSDERTWGGDGDGGDGKQGLYVPEKEDKEADQELSSVGESEIEDGDDWDAEDWGIFRRNWSEEKKRSMVLGEFEGSFLSRWSSAWSNASLVHSQLT